MKNIALSASITSLEIAELVGSRHPDVRRSIDRLIKCGVIHTPETVFYARKTKAYLFSGEQGRRDSYVVVAKMSLQHLGTIIDTWNRNQNALNDAMLKFKLGRERPATFVRRYASQEEIDSRRMKVIEFDYTDQK